MPCSRKTINNNTHMENNELQSSLKEVAGKMSELVPEGAGALCIVWKANGDRPEGAHCLVQGVVGGQENEVRSDWATAMAMAEAMLRDRRVYAIASFALAEYAQMNNEGKE